MIDKLQEQIDKIMFEQNNKGISKFEGYSPYEMYKIINQPFKDDNPIKFMPLDTVDFEEIPIFQQILYLANLIREKGEIKLTQKGFLPTKIVAELCNQEFLFNEKIDLSRVKVYKEADSMSATLTRIIMNLSKLVKKRNNKLSLTKSGEKLLSDYNLLLRTIITVYCTRFNWAYFDGFGENNIGQMGFGFSLILLSKYGHKKRIDNFYSDKYFAAYPQLITEMPPPRYEFTAKDPERCYSLRTFDRFMKYFGLVELEQEDWDSEMYIWKTKLFDKLIKCKPHIKS
jgi:hypothetical protein